MKKNIIIVAFIFAALTLGCKLPDALSGSRSNANTATAPTESKPSDTAVATGDPKDDLVRSSKKFIELPFFTAQMDGTGKVDFQTNLKYAAPDRYHITQGGNKIETIIVGTDTYMKTGSSWNKLPVDVGSMIPKLRDMYTEDAVKAVTNVQFAGDDDLDGKPALVYTYDSQMPKFNTPISSKMWISKQNGLPIKVVIDYSSGDLKKMVINYDTDTPVTIESPIK